MLFVCSYCASIYFGWTHYYDETILAYIRRDQLRHFVMIFFKDLSHVLKMRKNAAAAVLAISLLLSFVPDIANVLIRFRRVRDGRVVRQTTLSTLCAVLGVLCAVLLLLLPAYNKMLHDDMKHLFHYRRNILALFGLHGYFIGREILILTKGVMMSKEGKK